MKIIGCGGLARSGKDTFCSIARRILTNNHYTTAQYSFASALKFEVEPFVRDVCKGDVWANDTKTKTDLRDFLVWYGTTWWRSRDPLRWIRAVEAKIRADMSPAPAVVFVTDVRYPNEADWIHNAWGGYLVHVSAFNFKNKFSVNISENGNSVTYDMSKVFMSPPNEQERINDPLVREVADYKLQWEMKTLSPDEVLHDQELRREVLKALNSCDHFNESLHL